MNKTQQDAIIALLWESLRRDLEHKDRRQTGWGTKTQQGLIASIERIIKGDNLPSKVPEDTSDAAVALVKAIYPNAANWHTGGGCHAIGILINSQKIVDITP